MKILKNWHSIVLIALVLFFSIGTIENITATEATISTENSIKKTSHRISLSEISKILKQRRIQRKNKTKQETTAKTKEIKSKSVSTRRFTSSAYSRIRNYYNTKKSSKSVVKSVSSSTLLQRLKYRNTRRKRTIKSITPVNTITPKVTQKKSNTQQNTVINEFKTSPMRALRSDNFHQEQVMVGDTENITVLKITIQNPNPSAIDIKTLRFFLKSGDPALRYSLNLLEEQTLVGTAQTHSGTGDIIFSNINTHLAAMSKKEFTLVLNNYKENSIIGGVVRFSLHEIIAQMSYDGTAITTQNLPITGAGFELIKPSNDEVIPVTTARIDGLGNSPIQVLTNTNNLEVITFEINNPNTRPITIDTLQFWPSSGSLFDYAVRLNSDGNTFNKENNNSFPEGFHFDNLNTIIPANGKKVFSVAVDITENGVEQVFKISLVGVHFNISGENHESYGNNVSIDSAKVWVVTGNNNNTSSQSIPLREGWNYISLFVNPDNSNIKSVFSELIDEGSLVQVKTALKFFDSNLPDFLNTLDTIEGAKGYTVKVSRDTVLTVEGETISVPYTYNLNAGWNLIGYPGTIEVNALCAVHEIFSEDTDMVLKDEDEHFVKDFNPHPQMISRGNSIGNLKPGKGYWINVSSPQTLSITANPADATSDLQCLNRY